MLALYTRHIRNCRTIRSLLAAQPSPNLDALYWYDLRLADAVSLPGMLRVFVRRLFGRGDRLSGSWGMQSIYYAEPLPGAAGSSNASVWNCRSLESRAWWDQPDEVKELLEQHAPEMLAEYHSVSRRIDTHPDNEDYVHQGTWNGLFLSGTGGELDQELLQHCPVTASVIQQLPVCRNFGFVAYSQLEAHTHIKAHVGSSNLRIRYHLGVDIPEPEQVRIRVGEEWRQWQQGGVIAFDDSFDHEVIHDGDRSRTILMIDVWHPGLTATDIEVLSHPVFGQFGK